MHRERPNLVEAVGLVRERYDFPPDYPDHLIEGMGVTALTELEIAGRNLRDAILSALPAWARRWIGGLSA